MFEHARTVRFFGKNELSTIGSNNKRLWQKSQIQKASKRIRIFENVTKHLDVLNLFDFWKLGGNTSKSPKRTISKQLKGYEIVAVVFCSKHYKCSKPGPLFMQISGISHVLAILNMCRNKSKKHANLIILKMFEFSNF